MSIALPSKLLKLSLPCSSTYASTPVLSFTALIAPISAPSLSAFWTVISPISTPLIFKPFTVPEAISFAPVPITCHDAFTCKRSEFLLITSAKTPIPVPALVEIFTCSIVTSFVPSTFKNFKLTSFKASAPVDTAIFPVVSNLVSPILSELVGPI